MSSAQEKLAEWIVAHRQLTPLQLVANWTWQHEGEVTVARCESADQRFRISGVSIPATADGGKPFHVNALDMVL